MKYFYEKSSGLPTRTKTFRQKWLVKKSKFVWRKTIKTDISCHLLRSQNNSTDHIRAKPRVQTTI